MGAAPVEPEHLVVVIERLLPLQPHLHVELVDECLDPAVQLILPQRRLTAHHRRLAAPPINEHLHLPHGPN
jgi:hypothetical protein